MTSLTRVRALSTHGNPTYTRGAGDADAFGALRPGPAPVPRAPAAAGGPSALRDAIRQPQRRHPLEVGWGNLSITCAGEYVGLEEVDAGRGDVYFGPLNHHLTVFLTRPGITRPGWYIETDSVERPASRF